MVPLRPSTARTPLKQRVTAAVIHLAVSALIASGAAVLVFTLWYPGAYRHFAGGQNLFLLIVGVDVVLGPMLTFLVFDLRKKDWPQLRRDLVVIGGVQAAALVYGLHVLQVARPIALVFEVDRFRMITAVQIHEPELPQALPAYRQLPLTGPWLLAAREPVDRAERDSVLELGFRGVDIGQRPRFWQPYASAQGRALSRSRPVGELLRRYGERRHELATALDQASLDPGSARFLPLTARGDWIVLLGPQGDVRGFAPFEGFF